MRIGLIAMSGIRVCDSELLRLGLTLPGFVERSKTIASLPSLGLLTVAAVTPPGHEICYREMGDLPGPQEPLEAFDLVAISTFTAQAPEAYVLGDRYRAAGSTVVLGGLHATALPAEAAEHAHAVVAGEGEAVWARVVSDAERGALDRVYRSDPRAGSLDDPPLPAFHLLEIPHYNRLTVQTSRGCPLHCSFCASARLLVPGYKQKSGDRVLAEIDRIRELWPRPFIEFADDNTFVNKRYWKQLLPRLAGRGVRWFTETDISVGDDDELLAAMRGAGCVEVLVGLESPVADDLAGLELTRDWKRGRQPDYQRAVRNIQRHGIRVNGCFVLGLDGQGADIFDRIHRCVEELELYDVQITLQTPFPGTALYDRLARAGRLPDPRPWARCTLFDLTYEPTPMSATELTEGFRELAVRLYSEDFTRWRRERFRLAAREAHRHSRDEP